MQTPFRAAHDAARGRPVRASLRAASAAVLGLAAALPLAGCGQKGPLVLPERDASDVVIRQPAGATAETPERREPSRGVPAVPAPTQAPSETAPRSTTPR